MPNLYKFFWTASIIGGGPGLFCPHFRLVAVFCHFCWHCAHVRRKIWKTSTFEFMAGDIFHQYCWFILDVGGFGYLHLFGTYLIIFIFLNFYFTLSNAYSSDKECHSRIKSFYNEYSWFTQIHFHTLFEMIDNASCIFDRNSRRVSHAIYFFRPKKAKAKCFHLFTFSICIPVNFQSEFRLTFASEKLQSYLSYLLNFSWKSSFDKKIFVPNVWFLFLFKNELGMRTIKKV